MVKFKKLLVSAAIFTGVAMSCQVMASTMAEQTGDSDPLGSRSIMSPAKIDARTAPSAQDCLEGQPCANGAAVVVADAGKTARSGEQIFNTVCTACHSTGAAGAPVVGNKEMWAPRIAKGMDTLYKHALEGFNAMPPHGTCGDCSEAEIKATVDYMVSKSK